MISSLKSKRIRRFLLLAGMLGLGLLVYWSWPLVEAFHKADAEILLRTKQLAKLRSAVAEGAALVRDEESLRQVLKQAESGLLSAATSSLAAADIQSTLSQIAAASGVEIRTVRVLKPEKLKHEGYLGIPVQFTVSSTVRQLKEILYKIETATKLLTVDNLRINVARFKKTAEIQSDITVKGFMKQGSQDLG